MRGLSRCKAGDGIAGSGAAGFASAGLDKEPASKSILIAPWPEADASLIDQEIERRFALFQEVLRGLREVRARQDQLSPKTVIEFSCRCDEKSLALLKPMQPFFESMASAKPTNIGPQVTAPPISAHFTASGVDVYVDLAGHIDVAAEIARKEKEAAKVDQLIAAKEKQLSNEAFVSRAPAAVIAKERAALDELRATKVSTESTLRQLRGA
jgi:valyl-tRNA synthetase